MNYHLGAQNDILYIIQGQAPASSNDHPNHNADRTAIARVLDTPEARQKAEELVKLANLAGAAN